MSVCSCKKKLAQWPYIGIEFSCSANKQDSSAVNLKKYQAKIKEQVWEIVQDEKLKIFKSLWGHP